MLKCARERYILCDSTKLNQNALCSFIKISEITALITDDDANPEYIKRMRDAGLKVILATIPRLSEPETDIKGKDVPLESKTLKKTE